MMRRLSALALRTLLATAAIVSVSRAQVVVGSDEAERAIKSLQGRWMLVALTIDGRKLEFNRFNESVLVHDGKKQTLFVNGEERGSFNVDVQPGEKPAKIDLTPVGGLAKGRKVQGIYKLEKDKLTVCTSHDPDRRPGDFVSEPGSRDTPAVYVKW